MGFLPQAAGPEPKLSMVRTYLKLHFWGEKVQAQRAASNATTCLAKIELWLQASSEREIFA